MTARRSSQLIRNACPSVRTLETITAIRSYISNVLLNLSTAYWPTRPWLAHVFYGRYFSAPAEKLLSNNPETKRPVAAVKVTRYV
jgi:hypothetical protein